MVHSQIVSNFERAWEITGRSEDELTGVMVQISQVVAGQFKEGQFDLSIPPLLWKPLNNLGVFSFCQSF